MSAKGYWIANTDTHDMDGLMRYREANRETMTRYGARFIVLHGPQQTVEGPAALPAWVVVEFPSYQAAVDCYHDPDYQLAAKIRHAASDTNQSIVAGYDGPQDM